MLSNELRAAFRSAVGRTGRASPARRRRADGRTGSAGFALGWLNPLAGTDLRSTARFIGGLGGPQVGIAIGSFGSGGIGIGGRRSRPYAAFYICKIVRTVGPLGKPAGDGLDRRHGHFPAGHGRNRFAGLHLRTARRAGVRTGVGTGVGTGGCRGFSPVGR